MPKNYHIKKSLLKGRKTFVITDNASNSQVFYCKIDKENNRADIVIPRLCTIKVHDLKQLGARINFAKRYYNNNGFIKNLF